MPRPRLALRPALLLPLLLAGATLAAVPGCNILGPALYLAHGPEKIDKLYELDPTRNTVVFIDDRANRIPRRVLRVTMAQEAERLLLEKEVLEPGKLISSQSALAAASTDKYDRPMPVSEIGRAVGADTVIYVTIDEFSLSPDGQSFIPSVMMRLKVIDAADEERLWPKENAAGHALRVRLPIKQGVAPTSLSAQMQYQQELAKHAGVAIAKVFYKHELEKGVNAPEY